MFGAYRGDEPGFTCYAHNAAWVFPTPVGMNRANQYHSREQEGVPHTRGDEPLLGLIKQEKLKVFPTPVGMNRELEEDGGGASACSPHPWG